MEYVYPVILTPTEDGYFVTVPDLEINTQGSTVDEAMEMAQDAINLWCTTQTELEKPIPAPTAICGMTREELDRELMLGIESIKKDRVYTMDELDAIFAEKYGI